MLSIRGARFVLCAALVAALGVAGINASTAGAIATPKIVVTPSANLRKGEAVKVSGTGFKAGDSVYIVQCLINATGEGGCDIANLKAVTISASGKLPPTYFHVTTGKVGHGKCGTATSNLKRCAVSVGNASGGDSAVAPIAFRALKKS